MTRSAEEWGSLGLQSEEIVESAHALTYSARRQCTCIRSEEHKTKSISTMRISAKMSVSRPLLTLARSAVNAK